ncbi:MAG: Eco29kI family restriction endonuclease [Deltaproteobacteria bacterium]|jgi:hypothetical protein|nr:Eco29kI family restriction endonuclease [Deltaproteobacteria bacterium]
MDDGNVGTPRPFNPLDKASLAKSLANALMLAEPLPMPPERTPGAGVYAIFYNGGFAAYTLLAERDGGRSLYPIYVGKADPPGSRKGLTLEEGESSYALFQRLRQHAKSIGEALNLELSDFSCRLLVVDAIWIPLAEAALIRRYQPLWNVVVDGFGNHDPGGKRKDGTISQWDSLHPGRFWAKPHRQRVGLPEELPEKAKAHLDSFFKDHPPAIS